MALFIYAHLGLMFIKATHETFFFPLVCVYVHAHTCTRLIYHLVFCFDSAIH